MTDTSDNDQKKSKFMDLKTAVMLGTILVSMALAWGAMSAKVDRFNEDLSEIKRESRDADLRLQSQVDDISGALALQAVSLGKIEAGVTYIQRSIDNLQKDAQQ